MVRIAVEPGAASGGAERTALIASILLDEVVAQEDLVRAVGQLGIALDLTLLGLLSLFARGRLGGRGDSIGLRIADDEVARQDNLVEEVPLALVEQSALTHLIEHIVPRVVERMRILDIFGFGDSLQFIDHRLVVRVVVQVSLDDDLDARIFLEQCLLEGIDLIAGTLAGNALGATARPVVDDDSQLLASHRADADQESTGDVGGVAIERQRFDIVGLRVLRKAQRTLARRVIRIDIEHVERVFEREETGIVEQAAVHTTAVRAIDMKQLITTVAQGLLLQDVEHHLAVSPPRGGFTVAVDEETPHERREVGPELALRGIVRAGPQDVDEFHEHVLHGVVRVGVGDAGREEAHEMVHHGAVHVDETGPGDVIDAAPGLAERPEERHRRLRIAPTFLDSKTYIKTPQFVLAAKNA